MSAARPDTSLAPLLEVRNLSRQFRVGGGLFGKQLHAIRDVSFTLDHRQVVALVGESGSGKSTTARALARLFPPTAGAILYRGEDRTRLSSRQAVDEWRRTVQMVFQDPFASLNPTHTIAHHLTRPLVLHGHAQGSAEAEAQVHDLLATVGLQPAAEVARKHPHELSGGQRQRVALARALAAKPQVVLADEPVSMLDVSIRIDILNLMTRLQESLGISYLYITHDLASARYIAQGIVVMYAGYSVEGGPTDEALRDPAHPYTRRLIAAVPRVAMQRTAGERQRATPPILVDPPPGCPFATNCPAVMPRCREVMPGVTRLGNDRWVRCHLHGDSTLANTSEEPGR